MGECEACRFWFDLGDEEDAKPRTGNCRRFPPVFVGPLHIGDDDPATVEWSQPTTGGHWQCGEFAPLDDPPESV